MLIFQGTTITAAAATPENSKKDGYEGIDKYFTRTEFNLEILTTPFRAKGVTKTVVTWYGVTQLWMNLTDTEKFILQLESRLGLISAASNVFGSGVATIIGSVSVLNISAVKSAALPGNGIIMNIQYEPITQTNNVWFVSQ